MAKIDNHYIPDNVSPPGETLEEILDERRMKQVEFAQRIGMSRKHLKQILDGNAPITPETALKFERALGVPARFWNNREQQYRDFLARRDEAEALGRQIDWLKNFKHLNRMMRLRWLPEVKDRVDKLRSLLNFFGVSSPESWEKRYGELQVRYRRSQVKQTDTYALAAWLRQGEIKGQVLECKPYNREAFQRTLYEIRKLTQKKPKDFQSVLVSMCAACGVAVAFVPELPNTASGATRWLSPDKALIQLSLRYKADDHLWFTFFHEAGHILLHPKKDIFIEGQPDDSAEEDEANRFAARMLIPDSAYHTFITTHSLFSVAAIRRFATEQGIAPGIVVGRLQHDGCISYTKLNGLKKKFEWRIQESDE